MDNEQELGNPVVENKVPIKKTRRGFLHSAGGAIAGGALAFAGIPIVATVTSHDSPALDHNEEELQSVEPEILTPPELERDGIHIFNTENNQLFLKKSVFDEFELFRDLKEGGVKGVNIVLLDEPIDLDAIAVPESVSHALGVIDPVRRPPQYWEWRVDDEKRKIENAEQRKQKYQSVTDKLLHPGDYFDQQRGLAEYQSFRYDQVHGDQTLTRKEKEAKLDEINKKVEACRGELSQQGIGQQMQSVISETTQYANECSQQISNSNLEVEGILNGTQATSERASLKDVVRSRLGQFISFTDREFKFIGDMAAKGDSLAKSEVVLHKALVDRYPDLKDQVFILLNMSEASSLVDSSKSYLKPEDIKMREGKEDLRPTRDPNSDAEIDDDYIILPETAGLVLAHEVEHHNGRNEGETDSRAYWHYKEAADELSATGSKRKYPFVFKTKKDILFASHPVIKSGPLIF